MSNVPANLKYTKEHEWALIESDVVTVGITDYAQDSLGDIVFVELPEIGTNLNINDPFGSVESIKSVSELYSPISGEVIEINETLSDAPESCNTSPYESWMVKVKVSKVSELEDLLSSDDYQKLCEA